jgi:hypothetical protein
MAKWGFKRKLSAILKDYITGDLIPLYRLRFPLKSPICGNVHSHKAAMIWGRLSHIFRAY